MNHRRLAPLTRALGPALALIIVWVFFAIASGSRFTDWPNQRLILIQSTVVGVAAIGATLILISGGLDLSVGSTIALTTVIAALIIRDSGATAGDDGGFATAAALVAIAASAAIGAAIGGMVTGAIARVVAIGLAFGLSAFLWPRLGPLPAIAIGLGVCIALDYLASRTAKDLTLSPFIITLGLWGALRGLAKGLGDNQAVYPGDIGWLGSLMTSRGNGLPAGVWILLFLALAAAFMLRYTRLGRHAIAIGSSEPTARLCGIRVERTKVFIYTLGVTCAGIAGILQFSNLTMGDPTTAQGYELKAIAAAVIGGASLSGGAGSIVGTLIGVLLMSTIDNGCNRLRLDNWVQDIVTGVIIIAAVIIDRLRRRATETE